MSKETLKVLELVAEGKITPEEGERLIKALGQAVGSSRHHGFGPRLPDMPEINIPKIDLGNLGDMYLELKNRVAEGTKEAQGKFRRSRAAKYLEFKDYPVEVEVPEGAEGCQLALDVRAGKLKFRAGDTGGKLLRGKAKRVAEEPIVIVGMLGESADVKVRNSLGRLNLRANPELAYVLSVNSAAAETHLDLEALNIDELNLDNNAGNMRVELGKLAKRVEVEINNNAGNLRLEVPESYAVRIALSGNLSHHNLERYGLDVVDGVAVSEDWDENPLAVDIILSQNVAGFKLEWARKRDIREATIESPEKPAKSEAPIPPAPPADDQDDDF